MNYYNEFDPFAAAWLQRLIDEGLIPPGYVDTRSITEVQPEDLGSVHCADGKIRRAPSGIPLLAHGVPNRVGRLRGFGNAIVPPLAAEFIQAFEEAGA